MNTKDAAVIAVLASLGLRKEAELTPEQEQLYKQAIDPDNDQWFLYNLEKFTVHEGIGSP